MKIHFARKVGLLLLPAIMGGLLGVYGQGFYVFGYGAGGLDYGKGIYASSAQSEGVRMALYEMNVSFAGLIAKKVYGHIEFESEEGELGGVEQAWLAWRMARNQRLIVGKFVSYFGAFSQYYHVPWIHRLQEPPLGLQKVAPMPLVNVGVAWTGVLPVGKASSFYYDLFMSEGWEEDTLLDFAEWGEKPPTYGGNKVYGGRIGMFLPLGMEIRASVMQGANISAQAVDFYWRKKSFLMRGEYDMYKVMGKSRSGYFVELAYRTRANIEPVLVLSGYSIEPTASSAVFTKEEGMEIGVGANYYLSAASALRLTVKSASQVQKVNNQDVKSDGLYGALTFVTRF